jgi:hypothetical protein
MVGPKKQDFWSKINILIRKPLYFENTGAPIRQRLGIILENKVVQKKCFLEKMVYLIDIFKCIFFLKKFCRFLT